MVNIIKDEIVKFEFESCPYHLCMNRCNESK